MKVIKRDGRSVEFNSERIRKAVNAARCEVHVDDLFLVDTVTGGVCSQCYDGITVEKIQDLVEKELVSYGQADVAKAFILYRDKRTKARHRESDQAILSIIKAEHNDITRENANMNADTPAGMVMKIASERSKELAYDYLLSEETLKAIKDNGLHVHDLDYLATRSLTCIQHPVDKILSGGFQAGHGESRPAKRIETASILACISMESVQNVQHGGQSIPALDFYMAPYVRATFKEELQKIEKLGDIDLSDVYETELGDYLIRPLSGLVGKTRYIQHAINETVKRVHQSMEALIHNLNTIHSRGGEAA